MQAARLNMKRGIYFGEPGSLTENAFDGYLYSHPNFNQTQIEKHSSNRMESIFQAVEDGEFNLGCVPFQNSTSGDIGETVSCLGRFKVFILGDWCQKHSFCLCVVPGVKRKEIRYVHSHERVIQACNDFLEVLNLELFTKGESREKCRVDIKQKPSLNSLLIDQIEWIREVGTTTSARKVSKLNDRQHACICSEKCANLHNLEILEKNVADDKNITSRFLILSQSQQDINSYGLCELNLMMTFILPNKPLALFKVLSIFAFRNVNLLHIFQKPLVILGEKQWKYRHFVIIQPDNRIQADEIFSEIEKWTVKAKNLGLYPRHYTNLKQNLQNWNRNIWETAIN